MPGRESGNPPPVCSVIIVLVLGKIAYRERVVPSAVVVRTTAATAMDTVVVADATHGPTASASILYVNRF